MSPADVKVTQAPFPTPTNFIARWSKHPERWAAESAAICVLAPVLQAIATEQLCAMLAAVQQAAFEATREAAAHRCEKIDRRGSHDAPCDCTACAVRALTLADVLPKP
jgi:hypothetical protein